MSTMTYGELLQLLFAHDFRRIERDDRLLDIFPEETREKGVELWDLWGNKNVQILRVRLPYDADELTLFEIPRAELEQRLQDNESAKLDDYSLRATGNTISRYLS